MPLKYFLSKKALYTSASWILAHVVPIPLAGKPPNREVGLQRAEFPALVETLRLPVLSLPLNYSTSHRSVSPTVPGRKKPKGGECLPVALSIVWVGTSLGLAIHPSTKIYFKSIHFPPFAFPLSEPHKYPYKHVLDYNIALYSIYGCFLC